VLWHGCFVLRGQCTWPVYNILMIEWRKVNVCEVCGWSWLPLVDGPPALHCPSRKCRAHRSRWNASAERAQVQPAPQVEQPHQVEASSPPSAHSGRSTLPRRGKASKTPKAAAAPALNPTDHVQPTSSLPPVSSPIGGQVSCVRPDQSVVQPSDNAAAPSRFAQVVKELSTPHAFGARCPHDFANWLACPDCNPPRR
jgi:hypothetical protein